MRVAFILKPHKSLYRISEEYNIKFSDKDFKRITDALVNALKEGDIKILEDEIRNIGKSKGLKGRKLENFTNDVCRTVLFYTNALNIIREIIEMEEFGAEIFENN